MKRKFLLLAPLIIGVSTIPFIVSCSQQLENETVVVEQKKKIRYVRETITGSSYGKIKVSIQVFVGIDDFGEEKWVDSDTESKMYKDEQDPRYIKLLGYAKENGIQIVDK